MENTMTLRKSSIEAFLMVAAHYPKVTALVYTDMAAAIALAHQEFEVSLTPGEITVLMATPHEALKAAISAAKNADQVVTPKYDGTRGLRPDMP
jgi:hypothetical protein